YGKKQKDVPLRPLECTGEGTGIEGTGTTPILTTPSPDLAQDGQGTKVAGIAAAISNNTTGITGVAYQADILPVRLNLNSADPIDCVSVSDALRYAAKNADVISNSWETGPGFPECQTEIGFALSFIASESGTLAQKRRGNKGTPIVFASGNTATGWRKVSINIPAGTVKLTLHKDIFESSGEDAVWIDDITLPSSSLENIGAALPNANWSISNEGANISGGDVYARCDASASGDLPVSATGNHAKGGDGHAIKLSTSGSSCKFLQITGASAGTLEFWVWVSIETWNDGNFPDGDLFRVYINNNKVGNNLISRSAEGIDSAIFHDTLAYPASHASVISVGASDDGSLFGHEDRAYFSQYSPNLSLVAPGTQIITTAGSSNYSSMTGTSASAPMVAGVIANMLAVNNNLTEPQIRDYLQDSADQIGPEAEQAYDVSNEYSYNAGHNKYYGHGRLNAHKAVQMANNVNVLALAEAPELCEDPNPGAIEDDFLLLMIPAIISGALKNKQ
ncbi:MAG: S8 family serine peptidase, partial [Arenicellales bacterium]